MDDLRLTYGTQLEIVDSELPLCLSDRPDTASDAPPIRTEKLSENVHTKQLLNFSCNGFLRLLSAAGAKLPPVISLVLEHIATKFKRVD